MELRVIESILLMREDYVLEFWYLKGQDGNWYRADKYAHEPFDEFFWQSFDRVPWYGY